MHNLKTIALAFALFTAAPCLLAGLSRSTADWVKANAASLAGKNHSVQVAFVSPGRVDGDSQWFSVYTYDDGNGSYVDALVLSVEASRFANRFGTDFRFNPQITPRTKRLDAIVRISKAGFVYLDVR